MDNKSDTLSQRIDSLLQTIPDFSGVVYVGDHGKTKFHKAVGYRSFQKREPNDTASVFELASLSKQFTAMVIMMLKEEGKLTYEDLVTEYIPELPYTGITIRHLLNHTSGLPDYQDVMDRHWDKTKVAGNNDNIRYLAQYRPEIHFAPGERFEYSNTGYMLLATIAEKASGKDFIALCRENIFTPLKMTSTGIRTKEEKLKVDNMAWGHLYVPEKKAYVQADSFPEFNYSLWLGHRKGPGRISSTCSDLQKWDDALYSGQLVTNETIAEAFSPARLNNGSFSNYGFGWTIKKDEHGKVVLHTGDNPGYKTIIIRYLDFRQTVIVLNNNGHENFDRLVKGITSILDRN